MFERKTKNLKIFYSVIWHFLISNKTVFVYQIFNLEKLCYAKMSSINDKSHFKTAHFGIKLEKAKSVIVIIAWVNLVMSGNDVFLYWYINSIIEIKSIYLSRYFHLTN